MPVRSTVLACLASWSFGDGVVFCWLAVSFKATLARVEKSLERNMDFWAAQYAGSRTVPDVSTLGRGMELVSSGDRVDDGVKAWEGMG